MSASPSTVDITPTPQILRTLGEIPFAPWQCMAELIDNSLDAFAQARRLGLELPTRRIVIAWSSDSVAAPLRTLEINDTGPGMRLTDIQNAARAGYSSNDPMNNLGLFGMGFNIATARLGEKTQFISATIESTHWEGIELDLHELAKSKTFQAKVVRIAKDTPSESGTRIRISGLKPGMHSELIRSELQTRQTLEDVYSPVLAQGQIEVLVQGKVLVHRPPCIWSPGRRVAKKNSAPVHAVFEFEHSFGAAFFDLDKNSYLGHFEAIKVESDLASGIPLPDHVVKRDRKIHGWVGIQRFADPNQYGLDFIRNGRKILLHNKSLFYFENPLSASSELEYPVELGNTVGGRIVGEIWVDHLKPTYQKNDFDRTDVSWREIVEYLRGIGPILPKKRKALGLPDNNSPIATLVNAYRRVDAGTKYLFAPNRKAKEWATRFRNGDLDFKTDEKWWLAAQEADRESANGGAGSAPVVDPGVNPQGAMAGFGPNASGASSPAISPSPATPAAQPVIQSTNPTSSRDQLKLVSSRNATHSGEVRLSRGQIPLSVSVYEINPGSRIQVEGKPVPFIYFKDGTQNEFFYDPKHPFLNSYPYGFREILALYLADRFKMRDNLKDLGAVYREVLDVLCPDLRIDKSNLQEKAKIIFDRMRELWPVLLRTREMEVINCVHESIGETEETYASLIVNPDLLGRFQNREPGSLDALDHVPARTFLRIIEKFPEELFDNKFFRSPYTSISLPDPKATERIRQQAKDRVIVFLKDALWVGDSQRPATKEELTRCSHSLRLLDAEIET